jgi:hypothetical protein
MTSQPITESDAEHDSFVPIDEWNVVNLDSHFDIDDLLVAIALDGDMKRLHDAVDSRQVRARATQRETPPRWRHHETLSRRRLLRYV